jgi:hypothetical protein
MARLTAVSLVFLLFTLCTAATLYADSIQYSGHLIDWEHHKLHVYASRQVIPQDNGNVIDWQLEAAKKAEQDLLRNFIDAMKHLQVDGYRTAHDVLYQDLERNKHIYAFFNSVESRSISYNETEVVAEKVFDFYGRNGFVPILFKAGREAGKFPEYCDYVFSTEFSGLIIDARGLGRKRAIAPRILDQGHNIVFSADLMEQYHFDLRGAVLYVTDANDSQIDDRVGNNPFTTVAIPDEKLLDTDIAIFNEDARVLLHHPATATNLQMGRVVIIVDSTE